jgi:hypothetical protein
MDSAVFKSYSVLQNWVLILAKNKCDPTLLKYIWCIFFTCKKNVMLCMEIFLGQFQKFFETKILPIESLNFQISLIVSSLSCILFRQVSFERILLFLPLIYRWIKISKFFFQSHSVKVSQMKTKVFVCYCLLLLNLWIVLYLFKSSSPEKLIANS